MNQRHWAVRVIPCPARYISGDDLKHPEHDQIAALLRELRGKPELLLLALRRGGLLDAPQRDADQHEATSQLLLCSLFGNRSHPRDESGVMRVIGLLARDELLDTEVRRACGICVRHICMARLQPICAQMCGTCVRHMCATYLRYMCAACVCGIDACTCRPLHRPTDSFGLVSPHVHSQATDGLRAGASLTSGGVLSHLMRSYLRTMPGGVAWLQAAVGAQLERVIRESEQGLDMVTDAMDAYLSLPAEARAEVDRDVERGDATLSDHVRVVEVLSSRGDALCTGCEALLESMLATIPVAPAKLRHLASLLLPLRPHAPHREPAPTSASGCTAADAVGADAVGADADGASGDGITHGAAAVGKAAERVGDKGDALANMEGSRSEGSRSEGSRSDGSRSDGSRRSARLVIELVFGGYLLEAVRAPEAYGIALKATVSARSRRNLFALAQGLEQLVLFTQQARLAVSRRMRALCGRAIVLLCCRAAAVLCSPRPPTPHCHITPYYSNCPMQVDNSSTSPTDMDAAPQSPSDFTSVMRFITPQLMSIAPATAVAFALQLCDQQHDGHVTDPTVEDPTAADSPAADSPVEDPTASLPEVVVLDDESVRQLVLLARDHLPLELPLPQQLVEMVEMCAPSQPAGGAANSECGRYLMGSPGGASRAGPHVGGAEGAAGESASSGPREGALSAGIEARAAASPALRFFEVRSEPPRCH